MEKKVLAKFECRAGMVEAGENDALLMYSFYNTNGQYIGRVEDFTRLVVVKGIVPETNDDNDAVCSIGKSLRDGKWYGWSHRAICGFQVGDTVKEGDCCASSGWTDEYLKDHPDEKPLPVGFEAKNEEDCRRMAQAFASSVS